MQTSHEHLTIFRRPGSRGPRPPGSVPLLEERVAAYPGPPEQAVRAAVDRAGRAAQGLTHGGEGELSGYLLAVLACDRLDVLRQCRARGGPPLRETANPLEGPWGE